MNRVKKTQFARKTQLTKGCGRSCACGYETWGWEEPEFLSFGLKWNQESIQATTAERVLVLHPPCSAALGKGV